MHNTCIIKLSINFTTRRSLYSINARARLVVACRVRMFQVKKFTGTIWKGTINERVKKTRQKVVRNCTGHCARKGRKFRVE
jgi:hypothetical protein